MDKVDLRSSWIKSENKFLVESDDLQSSAQERANFD
jgi:hypothetical protein